MKTPNIKNILKRNFLKFFNLGYSKLIKGKRLCPVCGKYSPQFGSYGVNPRKDAQCSYCGSLERHRLLWLYLKKRTDFFDGRTKKMLHVAPEQCFESRFRMQLADGYLTADLNDERTMVRMDITDIQYDDSTFDVIYCSHVLEHVLDDRKAMREFHRVLKSDGWAILLVPIWREKTYEDTSIIDPAARLQAFGQHDHVRSYGLDYIDRLRDAGFQVLRTTVSDLVSDEDAQLMGINVASGDIYFCTK